MVVSELWKMTQYRRHSGLGPVETRALWVNRGNFDAHNREFVERVTTSANIRPRNASEMTAMLQTWAYVGRHDEGQVGNRRGAVTDNV